MRQVLLALEVTSNGRTASWNSSGGGGNSQPIPALALHDTPHLYWQERWNVTLDFDRPDVLAGARKELDEVRRSRADRSEQET